MKLDDFDLRILGALQRDASQTLADIAEQAALSATPCWRRIQRLEAAGIIRKRVALLDREQLNAGTTVFVAVRVGRRTTQSLEKFSGAVRGMPEVVDLYRISGEIEY